MKHFIKKHTHHFGLWALSGLLLIWSIIWINNLNQNKNYTTNETITPTSAKTAVAQLTAPPPNNAANKIKFSQAKQKNEQPISTTSFTVEVIPDITPAEQPDEKKISVIFKFISPASTKEFSIQVAPQSTVYDAMRELQTQIPIKFKNFSNFGAFVETIDNIANDSHANLFWIYYINNEAAKLGISFIKLNPNDVITWRYEQGKF
ncbi:MAG: DUF4430 domain-containing protein [Patescibacteria group bacterium]